MARDDHVPPEVGYTIDEYQNLPCARCGGNEKQLTTRSYPNGYAFLILTCLHCRLSNKWVRDDDERPTDDRI